MIRLLLDQGLPRSTVQHISDQGFDACHVADIGYSRATDETSTDLALELGRVIVTLDSDFHRLLAISGANGPSVIRIRREGLRGPEVATLIVRILAQIGDQIEAGATCWGQVLKKRTDAAARGGRGRGARSCRRCWYACAWAG